MPGSGFVLKLNTEVGPHHEPRRRRACRSSRASSSAASSTCAASACAASARACRSRQRSTRTRRPSPTARTSAATSMYYENLELEFPIIDKVGIRGVVFFDAGNAWNLEDQFCKTTPAPQFDQRRAARASTSPTASRYLRTSHGLRHPLVLAARPAALRVGLPARAAALRRTAATSSSRSATSSSRFSWRATPVVAKLGRSRFRLFGVPVAIQAWFWLTTVFLWFASGGRSDWETLPILGGHRLRVHPRARIRPRVRDHAPRRRALHHAARHGRRDGVGRGPEAPRPARSRDREPGRPLRRVRLRRARLRRRPLRPPRPAPAARRDRDLTPSVGQHRLGLINLAPGAPLRRRPRAGGGARPPPRPHGGARLARLRGRARRLLSSRTGSAWGAILFAHVGHPELAALAAPARRGARRSVHAARPRRGGGGSAGPAAALVAEAAPPAHASAGGLRCASRRRRRRGGGPDLRVIEGGRRNEPPKDKRYLN